LNNAIEFINSQLKPAKVYFIEFPFKVISTFSISDASVLILVSFVGANKIKSDYNKYQ